MSNFKTRFGWLVLLSTLGYAVSFCSQLVIAYHFGTSKSLDAYWAGLALVGLMCFYMPPLKEAIVPAVHRAQAKGSTEPGRILSAGLSLLMILATLSCVILWVFAEGFAGLVTGVDKGAKNVIIALVPWLMPYMCIFVLAEMLNATLISFNRVLSQTVFRIAASVLLLATVAVVGTSLGVGGLLLAQILSMTTLIIASALVLRHLRLRPLAQAWPVLRDSGMVPLFVSLLLTYFLSQLYVLAERSGMIYLGAGLVSSFQYSVALVNVLISLVAYPLSNLLWSRFLACSAERDYKAAQLLAVRACGLIFYLLMVVCTFIWIHAHEIIVLLYGRGAFDETSVQLTTIALRSTIFTAIPISITTILGRWLMSLPSAHRQLWIGLTTTVVGTMIIGGAVLANSSRWIMLHWLLANLAGMFVFGAIFVISTKADKYQKIAAVRWMVSAMVIAILAVWMAPLIAFGDSKIAVAAALIAQGGIYLVIALGLTWILRMVPTLQMMFRGEV